MKTTFTIVILTKNSIGVIERLVQCLLNQKFNHDYEVIFMDNSSTDNTVDYLKKTSFQDKRIINVPEGEFSHSGTRMKAAEIAKGDVIIFFTDDIIPIGNQFLEELTKPILEDKANACYGVCQIDPATCDPIDAYLHNNWFPSFDDVTESFSQFCWDKFPPELRRRLCNFDNCSSCIKKDTLLKLKFPNVPYGEDMLFAKKLLLNQHNIALSKNARFFHWHKVSFTYLMKRMCIDQYLSIPEFGIYYVRRKIGVIKAILIRILHRSFIAFFKLKIPFSKKFYWSFYNIKTMTADFIGKYIGILKEDSAKGFSPINKRLLKRKNEIIDEIYSKSIKRY
jgi:rhamnosyltransferase